MAVLNLEDQRSVRKQKQKRRPHEGNRSSDNIPFRADVNIFFIMHIRKTTPKYIANCDMVHLIRLKVAGTYKPFTIVDTITETITPHHTNLSSNLVMSHILIDSTIFPPMMRIHL